MHALLYALLTALSVTNQLLHKHIMYALLDTFVTSQIHALPTSLFGSDDFCTAHTQVRACFSNSHVKCLSFVH
jgi:hypothetical protein